MWRQNLVNRMNTLPYWSIPAEEMMGKLHSTPNGLSQTNAQEILQREGLNRIQSKEQITPLRLFLNQFKSPIVLILIFATLVSAFLRDWVDAVIILVIVMGSALLSFYQEFHGSNAAEKLRGQISLKTVVLRDGKSVSVPSEQIVPGDI